jgi:hypothetical protein
MRPTSVRLAQAVAAIAVVVAVAIAAAKDALMTGVTAAVAIAAKDATKARSLS